MNKKKSLPPSERIENKIHFIRGQKVMIDSDLAVIYGVTTKRVNEQVKRNIERFPEDFMLQLSVEEWKNLKSQFATSSWGGRRKLPYAFTEHGAVMLASVLSSPVAVQASILVVRAFVRLREIIATHKEMDSKMELMEMRLDGHDEEITTLFKALRKLMETPNSPRKRIGFKTD